jgi:hypothetical protein
MKKRIDVMSKKLLVINGVMHINENKTV